MTFLIPFNNVAKLLLVEKIVFSWTECHVLLESEIVGNEQLLDHAQGKWWPSSLPDF